MTKYIIVGALNLFLGVLEVIYPLFTLVFTIPRLTTLYSEFGAEMPSFTSAYLIFGLIMLMGIGNLFFGINLVSKSKKRSAD